MTTHSLEHKRIACAGSSPRGALQPNGAVTQWGMCGGFILPASSVLYSLGFTGAHLCCKDLRQCAAPGPWGWPGLGCVADPTHHGKRPSRDKSGCRFITAWCALVFGRMQDCPWAMTSASSSSYVWLGACDWQDSLNTPMARRPIVLRAIFVGHAGAPVFSGARMATTIGIVASNSKVPP